MILSYLWIPGPFSAKPRLHLWDPPVARRPPVAHCPLWTLYGTHLAMPLAYAAYTKPQPFRASSAFVGIVMSWSLGCWGLFDSLQHFDGTRKSLNSQHWFCNQDQVILHCLWVVRQRCYWGRCQLHKCEQLMARGAGVVGIVGVVSISPAWWVTPCSSGLEAIIKLTSADLVWGKWDKMRMQFHFLPFLFLQILAKQAKKDGEVFFFTKRSRGAAPETTWDTAVWNVVDPHGHESKRMLFGNPGNPSMN